MFYKCSSLSSFPDISKWDTSNLTGTDFMFCHCSSLSSFPDISKWNTKKLIYTYNMFKNNIILINFSNLTKFVKKIPKINIKKDNIFLRYFESILDIINYIDLGYGLDYYSAIQYYFTILLTIFFAFFIYKGPFTPLDNSFNLVKLYNYINNQINYSNILNHSDINIFRKMINDNTISTIIDIGPREKEILINKIKILNFTSINGNISFESDKIYYQVYNIIIVIIFF
jgi:surface protein